MDYRFEICCEALFMHEELGMPFKDIAAVTHTRTYVASCMAGMVMGLDRGVVREVGRKQVVERYKREIALKEVA